MIEGRMKSYIQTTRRPNQIWQDHRPQEYIITRHLDHAIIDWVVIVLLT